VPARIVWYGDAADAKARVAGAAAVTEAAEFLLEMANRTVPIEEGTLMGSGEVSSDPANMRAHVSYSGPYSRRQHESLNYRHDAGRRAKWLERTFAEQRGAVLQMLAARLRTTFR
jgi:hypothetical protein